MKKTHGGDGEVTPVSTGTTFAGPVLLTQLAVPLVNFKGCCRQGNPEEQETGGSRAPEESSPGKVVHPENTSLSKETKKKFAKRAGPLPEWLSISAKESRDPGSIYPEAHRGIIPYPPPMRSLRFGTFMGKTETMSCWKFAWQITATTWKHSGWFLLA